VTTLLELALRSSVALGAALLFDAVLNSRAAALRHCVLAVAILAAAAILPLSLMLPAWHIGVPVALAPPSALLAPVSRQVSEPASTVTSSSPLAAPLVVLPMIWAAGTAIAGSALLIAFARLRRTTKRGAVVCDEAWTSIASDVARSFGVSRAIDLIQTNSPELLATWGARRPCVLLPSHAPTWSEDRMRIVLSHELAHIARHDWIVQVAAEMLRAVAWFHPLMWMACTRLRRAAEQACDDAVLRRGIPAPAYAGHLIELARDCRPAVAFGSATPMADPSTLERRIVAMLNPRLDRQPISRRAALAVALSFLALAVPTAILRAGQDGPRVLGGAIYDTSGAVMPGVTITLEDANQSSHTATTDASGRFEFGVTSAGKYLLAASLPGFRPLRQEFELRTARDWDRAITMPVGSLSETITVQSTRISGAVTATQPGPAPVRVGGNIRVPRKTLDVRPIYPDSMRAAGREGVVAMDAVIGTDGAVSGVRVVSADVHPDFAIAAAEAVRQWRFTPTLLNGAPIEVVMTVKVTFNLAQ